MLFFIFLVGQKLCLLFLVFFTQNKSLDTDMFEKENTISCCDIINYYYLLVSFKAFLHVLVHCKKITCHDISC